MEICLILIAVTEYLKIENLRKEMFIWAQGLRGYRPPQEWRQGRVYGNRKERLLQNLIHKYGDTS